MNEMDRADVVVIGAGVVGLAIAYEAARRGHSVLVLERDRIGAGAAGVAAGMLAPASEADCEDPALISLALESCRLYPGWVASIEADSGMRCRYRTEGSLLVALHHDHLEELERLAAFQQGRGLDVRWLTAAAIQAREPGLSPRVIGGLFAEGDRQIDPRFYMPAMAAAIRAHGGEILAGASVTSIVQSAGRATGVCFTLAGDDREVRGTVIVVAAGAWSNGPLAGVLPPLPLRPVKGQILRLRPGPPLRHVIRTADVYLVSREDGELVVGATSEERGFDSRPTAGPVMDLLREAWRVLPLIYELELAELGVGLRPALRDGLPIIGPSPLDGLWLAAGHYRHGIMLAPVTARLLLDAMDSGDIPPLLAPFQLDRFTQNTTQGVPVP
ncbi:MAG: glycine oxidase ThiO [Dehalococcoidia bacterium]|nr:glycine oxidase ThiO [Dehalococcoidia bacterium]